MIRSNTLLLTKLSYHTNTQKNVRNYSDRLAESVVGVFNNAQIELNRKNISNYSASRCNWLSSHRLKVAIYTHKSDWYQFTNFYASTKCRLPDAEISSILGKLTTTWKHILLSKIVQ